MNDYNTWNIRKLRSFLKELQEGGEGMRELILKRHIRNLIEAKRREQKEKGVKNEI
tara:strand:- start:275 stop:442 length:168 start_codon:yes stop_codon:yes gene_type:complete